MSDVYTTKEELVSRMVYAVNEGDGEMAASVVMSVILYVETLETKIENLERRMIHVENVR